MSVGTFRAVGNKDDVARLFELLTSHESAQLQNETDRVWVVDARAVTEVVIAASVVPAEVSDDGSVVDGNDYEFAGFDERFYVHLEGQECLFGEWETHLNVDANPFFIVLSRIFPTLHFNTRHEEWWDEDDEDEDGVVLFRAEFKDGEVRNEKSAEKVYKLGPEYDTDLLIKWSDDDWALNHTALDKKAFYAWITGGEDISEAEAEKLPYQHLADIAVQSFRA